MRTFIRVSLLLTVCLAVSSCVTKQKITVFGAPGTEILYPDYKKVGTIQSNGQLQFKLKLDGDYYPFLISHKPETEEYVPLALDYKHKNNSWIQPTWTILTISAVGIPISAAMSPFIEGFGNTTVENNFKYLTHQHTNDDFVFTEYANTGEKRAVGLSASIGTSITKQETFSTARTKTSKAARTLKDYGKAVAGTYRGTGKLRQGDTVVESYNNMTLTLERIDKNTVTVTVTDDYGEPFFSRADRYVIKKGRGRSYRLTLSGIPSATISVNDNGKLTYYHPKVNIDGDIYTLEISASKR